jgi:hypothetical protein
LEVGVYADKTTSTWAGRLHVKGSLQARYRRIGDMRKGCLHADAAKIVLKDMSLSSSPSREILYAEDKRGKRIDA